MSHIVGISGSLRRASFNTALLNAAAGLMPAGSTLDIRSIAGIPLYDGDVEARDGIPGEASALKDAIAAADGLLIVTPEYNNSIPGVLKNAIDWLSRPPADIVLRWKPVAVLGASSGRGGTRKAQQQVRDALLFPGAVVVEEPEVAVPIAWERFDPDLRLTDENVGAAVTELVAALVGSIPARAQAEAVLMEA